MATGERASVGGLIVVYVLLLVLLAGSIGLSHVDLGLVSPLGILGIAGLQAALIMAVYMGLRWSSPLVRVVAIGGVFFLSFLVVLLLADYLTRGMA
jgi:caa(3)-type oxidase subunit IV